MSRPGRATVAKRYRNTQPRRIQVLAWLAVFLAALWLNACTPAELPVPLEVPTPTLFSVEPVVESATPTPDRRPVTLRYALWDSVGLPAYQVCADMFMEQNPNIKIEIERSNFAEYWDTLEEAMAVGSAPDVFVNHPAHLADLAAAGQLLDLEPYMARDARDAAIYIGRLPRMWMRAGQRYGLPKDWDTIALVYNRDLLEAAGITGDELDRLEWNAQDGGDFQQMLARLTVDAGGNDALSPEFDASAIEQYGVTMVGRDEEGAFGQDQWSSTAASNGFRFTDYLFADQYHFDDLALIDTFAWYQRLIDEDRLLTPVEEMAETGGRQLFLEGKAAVIADASWMISTYLDGAPFDVGFALLPQGPQGRISVLSSTADSIWSGTPYPEAAWQWVSFLGSVACQLAVGEQGVAFPAIQSGTDRMLAHYDEMGVDVHAYTQYLSLDRGTILHPVTEHADEVNAIMQPVVESILRGDADPAVALPEANERVNGLFAGP